MKKIMVVLCLAVVIPVFLSSSVLAADKKPKAPEWKVKGQLIAHPDTNDVKILTDSYDTVTINVDKKTKINASVKASLTDMANEGKLPKGEVSFTFVDGKPVATRVTFGSGQKWKVSKPKKKEE